jgi:hypothetical protein
MGGGGNVSNVGTPVSGQIAQWTGATTIQGLANTGSGNNVLATNAVMSQLTLQDPTTNTKQLVFGLSNLSALTTVTLTIPNATCWACVPFTAAAGQFVTSMSGGVFTWGAVAVSNLSGLPVTPAQGGTGANNTPTSNLFLVGTGTTFAPRALATADLPQISLTGDVTGAAAAGSIATTYNNVVPTAKGGTPTAGAAGAILKKNTATNYDCGWDTPSVAQVSAAANPPAVTTTVGLMNGLGTATYGPFLFTPQFTGKVLVMISFFIYSNTASASLTAGMRYGTGTAPANGAANTGTGFGTAIVRSGTGWTVANQGTFATLTGVITGLTPGTQYWFDISSAAGASAQAVAITSCNLSVVEFP